MVRERVRIRIDVSHLTWVWLLLELLSVSFRTERSQGCRTGLHVHYTCSCAVNSLHYSTCSEKNLNFSCPFPSLFSVTPCVHTPFPRPKLFFSRSKKTHVKEKPRQNNLKTRRGKHWNVFVRRGEGHQTGATLVRGLPYISSRQGDQRSLEKYAHGRESQVEGWHKKLACIVVWVTTVGPSSPGTTWGWETVRKRCSGATHIHITLCLCDLLPFKSFYGPR